MPRCDTQIMSPTVGEHKSAGRISYATPSAGIGLMSPATQHASSAGRSIDGIGPRWDMMSLSWSG